MLHKIGTLLKIQKVAALTTLLENDISKQSKHKDVVEKKDNSNWLYFVARAIDCDIPNGNGDFFPFIEVEASYETFVGKGLYLNHDSDDITKAVGKIIDSYLVKDTINKKAWVECICKVDRIAHPDIARQVEMGIIDAVSMGCTCETAVCNICDKEMHTVADFCEHMKSGLLRQYPKGIEMIICYSINKGLMFNELSLVGTPADPDAKIHKIFAALKDNPAKLQKLAEALKGFDEKELIKLNSLLDIFIDKKANESNKWEIKIIADSTSDSAQFIWDAFNNAFPDKELESIINKTGIVITSINANKV